MIASSKQSEQPELSAEQYHATDRMSNSKLKLFRENRWKFYRQHIAKDLPADQPTASKMLGTYLHLAILEPEKWRNRATPKPEYDFPETASDGKKWYKRKGSAHESEWNEHLARAAEMLAAWERENEGKICPNEKQIATVENMADALTHHVEARRLLELPAQPERTIFWQYGDVPFKSRLDKDLQRLILDLKTTKDASLRGFSRAVEEFGYHLQDDLYRAAKYQADNERAEMLYIAIESDEPHRVGVHEIEEEDRQEAAFSNAVAVDQYRACLASGNWREDWEFGVNICSRPAWARKANPL